MDLQECPVPRTGLLNAGRSRNGNGHDNLVSFYMCLIRHKSALTRTFRTLLGNARDPRAADGVAPSAFFYLNFYKLSRCQTKVRMARIAARRRNRYAGGGCAPQ